MKRKLFKPPENNGEIVFYPSREVFCSTLYNANIAGTAHQPYFFNPGVSLKFLFLDYLSLKNKKILFLDTDRVNLFIKIPSKEGIKVANFIREQRVLFNYPAPSRQKFLDFFLKVEKEIEKEAYLYRQTLDNLKAFKEIIISNNKELLKEILVEGFLAFYGLSIDYGFVSNLLKTKEFKDFFKTIYYDDEKYREVFNESLDDYRKKFRFRFANFPFPKLAHKELPFWIVKDTVRHRCFKDDIDIAHLEKLTIFPRASTLTIFLRLYYFDVFIHGIGGANYEWVNDRIIEQFFKREPASYIVTSGTFFIDDLRYRDIPYFFIHPEKLKSKIKNILSTVDNTPTKVFSE